MASSSCYYLYDQKAKKFVGLKGSVIQVVENKESARKFKEKAARNIVKNQSKYHVMKGFSFDIVHEDKIEDSVKKSGKKDTLAAVQSENASKDLTKYKAEEPTTCDEGILDLFDDVEFGGLGHNDGLPKTYTKSSCKSIDFDKIEGIMATIPSSLEDFVKMESQVIEQINYLRLALSKIDGEVCDIYHVIELSAFNASEGYALAKRLKETLKRRRIVKNAFTYCNAILETYGPLKKALESQRDKSYTFRVLDDLSIRKAGPSHKKKTI